MIACTNPNGPKIATIPELLATLGTANIRPNLLADFRTTANRLAEYLNVPAEKLSIDTLLDVEYGFRSFLEARRYKRSSVTSYIKFAQMMLRHAERLGWTPTEPEIPEAWRPILEAVRKAGCKDIVRYAMKHKISPLDFSDQDLHAWTDSMIARGRTYTTAQEVKKIFKSTLGRCGLADGLPKLSPSLPPRNYGISIKLFPTRLRVEVEDLLQWKQADFAPNRPHKCRHRAVTSEGLRSVIEQLYGFAINVEQANEVGVACTTLSNSSGINSLTDLVTKSRLTSWVAWMINKRKVLKETARGHVTFLYAAVRYYPDFKGFDFSWFPELIRQIPRDSRSGIEDRKLLKFVPYDQLAAIPNQIYQARKKLLGGPSKKIALLVRDELLIRWITTLPWRQRNIRECQMGVNLFKRELPPMGAIEIPKWVQDRLRTNPRETVWQFDFKEHGTKNGERSRAIVPRQLVTFLEEYLDHYRPLLLDGTDPGNLFLSALGRALDSAAVIDLVADITYRYTQKRVTPHICRDIFAYRWLQDRPRDYLTLSKHLWHKDLNTTLHIYGSRFDTSHAACEVEEWLNQREASAGQQS